MSLRGIRRRSLCCGGWRGDRKYIFHVSDNVPGFGTVLTAWELPVKRMPREKRQMVWSKGKETGEYE